MMKEICLVEPQEEFNQTLKYYLEMAGYTVNTCLSLRDAQAYLDRDLFAWVIAVMLPDGNGLELLRSIKKSHPDSHVAIISAKADQFDRVAGFEMGCDDYICKPFLPAELVYRLSRMAPCPGAVEEEPKPRQSEHTVSDYTLDTARRMVFNGSEPVELTSKEFDIISYFVSRRGESVSREQILDSLWGRDHYENDRIIDNYIKNIRKKLPNLDIETIYGYGYRCNI